MKKGLMAVLVMLTVAFADGPPLSGNNIKIPHFTFKLSEKQIKEAGIERQVTLTGKQYSMLQILCNKKLPKQLPIITYPYHECTCGLHYYGVWSKPDEIQVDTSVIADYIEEEAPGYKYHVRMLNLDSGLNAYHLGKRVEDMSGVIGKQLAAEVTSVTINTPPLLNQRDIDRVRKRLDEIGKAFKGTGITPFSFIGLDFKNDPRKKMEGLTVLKPEILSIQDKFDYLVSENSRMGLQVSASSYLIEGKRRYMPAAFIDKDVETAWSEGVPGYGTGEILYLSEVPAIPSGYLIVNGYTKSPERYKENTRVHELIVYFGNKPAYVIELEDTLEPQWVHVDHDTYDTKWWIRFVIASVYKGSKYEDTCLSMLLPTYDIIKYEDLGK